MLEFNGNLPFFFMVCLAYDCSFDGNYSYNCDVVVVRNKICLVKRLDDVKIMNNLKKKIENLENLQNGAF
jgi:hypothetical protein